MAKTIQYASKHWVKWKTRFVWEKKKHFEKINEMQCYFFAMLFAAEVWMFLQMIIFGGFAFIFVALCFSSQSCWKNYQVSWSMSGKSPTVGCLFRCCFQRTSPLLIRNIEHSCDQVTSRKILSKNRKLLSSRCPFSWLVLNKK